jgi:hypothetical protein
MGDSIQKDPKSFYELKCGGKASVSETLLPETPREKVRVSKDLPPRT